MKEYGYYLEEVTNNPDVVAELFAQEGGDARQYGLSRPTQTTFLDNGDAFVSEKPGRVRAIIDGELQRRPVLDISSRVNTYVDRGLNGLAVKDGWLYVAYTHDSFVTEFDGTKTARISKFPLVKNGSVYTADPDTEVRLVGTLDSTAEFPSCTDRPGDADCISTDAGSHSVGNLNFGPDGYLYAAVGDGAGFDTTEINAFDAQDIDNLSGKILRLTTDGQGVSGNPFFDDDRSADDNASKVWTYGLRNPTFFNFHDSSRVLVGNVGWYNTEGVYNMAPGDNAGWPCYENGLPSANGYERMLGCPLQTPVLTPVISYSHEERVFGGERNLVGAVTGVAVPTSAEYADDIRGTVVYPDYVLGFVNAARLNDDGSPAAATTLIEAGAQGAVGMTTDSEGYLYFMIHDQGQVDGLPLGTLYRLRYNNDPDSPIQPLPSFRALASEDGSLSKRFDASSSFDPAGRAATYRWDFGDGTVEDGEIVSHTYAEAGSYNVELTMTAGGVSAAVSQQVVVVEPPEEIAYPVVITPNIFGDGNEPRPDGIYEFVPSTEIPLRFSIRNQGSDVTFFTVVNIRPAGSAEQVYRVEENDQNLATDATKSYAFNWSTATPGEYEVDIEFYDQDTFQDLEGRYPAAATFLVTTRGGDDRDRDDRNNPMDPVDDPPANPNCTDEGDGNNWGVDNVTNTGCWINGEVDLELCNLADNGLYYCPDGEAYDPNDSPGDNGDDPMVPVDDPPANPNCTDEGDGNNWGVDNVTNTGCWINGEVDLDLCNLADNGLYYCPDGEAYDPNDSSGDNGDDPMVPVDDPPANPDCSDEGDGNNWGVDNVTNTGCWINGEVDLDLCNLADNGLYYCPDGKAYDPNEVLVP